MWVCEHVLSFSLLLVPSFMGSIVGYRKRAKQFFCIFGQWVGQPYLFNLGVCMVHSAMKFGGGGEARQVSGHMCSMYSLGGL